VLNIDGALDFDELNTPLYTPAAADLSSSPTSTATSTSGYPSAKGNG
ncbi:jg1975, partial [Pararge aegeria aegeria]